MLKYLIIIFTSYSSAFASNELSCIQSIQADYSSRHAISLNKNEAIYFYKTIGIDQSRIFFYSAQESCGINGCSYSLYHERTKGCLLWAGDISGRIEISNQKINGFNLINSKLHPDDITQTYFYSLVLNKYELKK